MTLRITCFRSYRVGPHCYRSAGSMSPKLGWKFSKWGCPTEIFGPIFTTHRITQQAFRILRIKSCTAAELDAQKTTCASGCLYQENKLLRVKSPTVQNGSYSALHKSPFKNDDIPVQIRGSHNQYFQKSDCPRYAPQTQHPYAHAPTGRVQRIFKTWKARYDHYEISLHGLHGRAALWSFGPHKSACRAHSRAEARGKFEKSSRSARAKGMASKTACKQSSVA